MSTFLTIIIYLATAALLIDCLILVLLVLIQLPKKEAGAGVAFGGGAADALFGAGSGNALTNITKYVVIVFFVLTLGLSILQNHVTQTRRNAFSEALEAKTAPKTAPAAAAQNKLLTTSTAVTPASSNTAAAALTAAPSTNSTATPKK